MPAIPDNFVEEVVDGWGSIVDASWISAQTAREAPFLPSVRRVPQPKETLDIISRPSFYTTAGHLKSR